MSRSLVRFIPMVFLVCAGCSQVEGWLRFDANLPADLAQPKVDSITSIDDDVVFPSLTDTPTITWTHPGLPTTGFQYEIAIGSTAGGSDVVAWTANGTNTAWTKGGLALTLNTKYYASVRVVDTAGKVYSVIQADGWRAVALVASVARYSVAPNWNDYANTLVTTSACAGTENGYFACIHGGERKKVAYTAATSCVGYTISDELGAFEWGCDATGGAGNVFFYTYGLKKSKGLQDLVNATSWKNNRVTISQAGVPVAASVRAAWWTNPVLALPDSPTAGTAVVLATGTVYTVASAMTSVGGYRIPFANKGVAVVTLPGVTLSSDPSLGYFTQIFLVQSASYLWFEGDFKGGTTNTNFCTQVGEHSVLRRARISGFNYGVGDGNNTAISSWINQVTLARNSQAGLKVKGQYSTYQEIAAISNAGVGVEIGDVSSNNVFVQILSANNGSNGLYSYNNDLNTLLGVTIMNNSGVGFESYSDDYLDVINLVSLNNTGALYIDSANLNTIGQYLGAGIATNAANNMKFTSNLILTSASCSVVGGTNPGLVNGSCANQGTSNATTVVSAGYGSTAFNGAVVGNDVSNLADTLGTAAFSAAIDWTHFDNPFRAWGKSGTFLAPAMTGQCTTGTCQIWDYSLAPLATQVKNVTGNGVAQNAAFVDGAPCPAAVSGNVVTVDRRGSPRTFLTNAAEMFGTGGNNNGVCESNETCFYLPNFGADQGTGDLRSKKCTFTNGTVTGVTMYGY